MIILIFFRNFQETENYLGFPKNMTVLVLILRLLFLNNQFSIIASISRKDFVVNQYIDMFLSFGRGLM